MTSTRGLKPIQQQVALSLAEGRTIKAAAAATGVHRSTIHLWLKNQPAFAEALQEAIDIQKFDRYDGIANRNRIAAASVQSVLDDPETSPAMRLRVAMRALKLS